MFDHVYVKRCFNCAGFGHNANDCRNKRSCAHCAEDHDTRSCEAKLGKCINCVNTNERLRLKIPTDHSSRSWECNSFKRQTERLEGWIKYSSEESK